MWLKPGMRWSSYRVFHASSAFINNQEEAICAYGYGELLVDVGDGTVTLDVNVRYNESNNEFWPTRDIATGEER